MKKYNVTNYVRYKEDLKRSINGLGELNYNEYTRNETEQKKHLHAG